MFATGIGLVLQGFKKLDNIKDSVDITSIKEEVTKHSNRERRGTFFDKFLNKTKEFFTDEN